MTANTVKNAVLRYFRFERQCPWVATECFDSDILASNGNIMNEIEVKISFGDYRREFKKAKYEDWRRAALEENRGQSCADKLDPNYMFFAAPEDLAHKIIADPECSKYGHGILVVKKRMHTFYSIQAGQYSKEIVEVEVLKRARKIHAHPVGEKTLQSIVSRLTSELITMREQVRQ